MVELELTPWPEFFCSWMLRNTVENIMIHHNPSGK